MHRTTPFWAGRYIDALTGRRKGKTTKGARLYAPCNTGRNVASANVGDNQKSK